MTAKTAEQISRAKTQTYGCEIEMVGITRAKAAQTAHEYFGGTMAPAHTGGSYDTYTAYDQQGRTWQFSRDSSLMADNPSEQCELVTPVLKYDDIELLQGLIRALRKAGAISNPAHCCGVHIHIGGDGHTPNTIRNLVNIMAAHERQLSQAVQISDRRRNYCNYVDTDFVETINDKREISFDDIARAWYNGPIETYHYSSTRYRMLNLHAFFNRYHTIEFRFFNFDDPSGDRKGGLHAGQLKAFIQLCLMLSQQAKDVKRASFRPQQDENPAYAFRCFMLRLGMIGDEFETARAYYMRNFDGDQSYRHTA